ncbi:MAG: IclR family transcriptional regulator [Burkholderiaceae bacterium]|nr:IclR family transcriptional regulator [Burkholderiaceae bacterium]
MMDTNSSGKTAIQVIERMTSLLDILARSQDSLTLKELARLSGLHPSTAHRILNDMVAKRLIDRGEPGTYRLGLRLLELGNVVKSRLNIHHIAASPIRELHSKTQQTVNLSVRHGDEIVYIDQAYQQGSGMQVLRAIGGHVPLHLSSAGKLFLAEETPLALRAYAERTGLRGTTRNSITELARLEQELRHVRTSGFSHDNEEWESGVRCIATAIRDDSGALIAGLSISAPAERLRDGWATDLAAAAEKISAALGYAAVK